MEETIPLVIDFSVYKEFLNRQNYEYFESPTELSFKKRTSSAEGTVWLKFHIYANEKNELLFTVQGPGIEYTGYNGDEAMKKFTTAKIIFDS